MFQSQTWIKFLSEIENLQMFSICNDFDNLTLEDKTGASASASASSPSQIQPSSYRCNIINYLRNKSKNLWSKPIIDKVQAPIIENPSEALPSIIENPSEASPSIIENPSEALPFIEARKRQACEIKMGISFRFPGQDEFLLQELRLPSSFDKLSFISKCIGLSFLSRPISFENAITYSYSGMGLRGLINKDNPRTLIILFNKYKGIFGRFFVLVVLGIGCTVWYCYKPAVEGFEHIDFEPFVSLDPFYNIAYNPKGFNRVNFLETKDHSALIQSFMMNELPFADITIPASSGQLLKAVSLGVMLAIFITVGIIPDECGETVL
jgi:hypothetical protein